MVAFPVLRTSYGMYFTIKGPITLANHSGMRFQVLIISLYLGLFGLTPALS